MVKIKNANGMIIFDESIDGIITIKEKIVIRIPIIIIIMLKIYNTLHKLLLILASFIYIIQENKLFSKKKNY